MRELDWGFETRFTILLEARPPFSVFWSRSAERLASRARRCSLRTLAMRGLGRLVPVEAWRRDCRVRRQRWQRVGARLERSDIAVERKLAFIL